ncbi:MAG: hypothetical protein HDR06_11370 [Lachnospiraceae bacterium]|nr:hypothetical protein [Lachnospiraceae bacterium]
MIYECAGIYFVDRGEKYLICKLEYCEEDKNFKYIFTPDYKMIAFLQQNKGIDISIQGINLNLHKKCYVRENFVPAFISERTPLRSRANLKELLGNVNPSEYIPLQWLKYTDLEYFGDKLIVK